ncbi:hypothetical protein C8Q79DRAFT_925448 [Trametes meyenii]|nr:hypothetical protein C8Q79DRAFT_925448 [Trametes meyenii]
MTHLHDPSPLVSPETVKDLAAALPTPASSPVGQLRRDEVFYCQDIVFQVEDILFRVSRRPFEEDSESFRTTFELPSLDRLSAVEGSSDECPLPLKGVTADEFRSLLRVLFPNIYGVPIPLTKEQWLSALKLADMWSFDKVRAEAILSLKKLTPSHAERVHIARLHNIPGWSEPALIALAQQDVLTVPDLQALGWSTVAKLLQVRDSIAFGPGVCTCTCNYCTYCATWSGNGAHPPSGARPTAVTSASLRRTVNFAPRVREVFGAEDLF